MTFLQLPKLSKSVRHMFHWVFVVRSQIFFHSSKDFSHLQHVVIDVTVLVGVVFAIGPCWYDDIVQKDLDANLHLDRHDSHAVVLDNIILYYYSV